MPLLWSFCEGGKEVINETRFIFWIIYTPIGKQLN